MIVALQNVSENLEHVREKEKLKMRISTKPFTNFSVWFTITFYECF